VKPSLALVPDVPSSEGEALYLTAADAEAITKIDAKTLYRWAKKDPTLPVLRINGVVRFPRTRFLKWLRDREQGRR
jgi:predicted site-specific integrase-resolvase